MNAYQTALDVVNAAVAAINDHDPAIVRRLAAEAGDVPRLMGGWAEWARAANEQLRDLFAAAGMPADSEELRQIQIEEVEE